MKNKREIIIEEKINIENQEYNDIAVIGINCLFPDANNIDEFWTNLKNSKYSIKSFPDNRKNDINNYIKWIKKENSNIEYKDLCHLDEIDKFDPLFFNITPDEASKMDPVQRLLMQVVWGALEDAGLTLDVLDNSNTGVFIGKSDFNQLKYHELSKDKDILFWTGSIDSMLAGRISYFLNLKGPSLVIDTACSSSLVAVHNACQFLKSKDIKIAIAGGVNLFIAPFAKEKLMMESPDNIIRPFDENANGTVWGEGLGVVVLKRLGDALQDNDQVYGVIKASGINSDGSSNGITAPNPESQKRLLVNVWQKYNINPENIVYFETHGTGTKLGDPIEVESITKAFSEFTDKKGFCPAGSVKSNIGHLTSASGIASLIKCLLIIKNEEIPPTVNFKTPNTLIDFDNSPVFINKNIKKIHFNSETSYIAINSFGISGTNCHMILTKSNISRNEIIPDKRYDIFTVSVKNKNVLKEYINKYYKYFLNTKDLNFHDVCYTVNTGRNHFNYRLAIVINSFNELIQKLKILLEKDNFNNLESYDIFYNYHRINRKNQVIGENREVIYNNINEVNEISLIKIKKILDHRFSEKLYKDIAKFFVNGSNIYWDILYKGMNVNKIHLPTYPFLRRRCWINYLNN